MRRRNRVRSMTAVTLLLLLSVGGMWMLSMVCLTVVTAQEIYDHLYTQSTEFLDAVNRCGEFDLFYEESSPRHQLLYERPDMLEYKMFQAISMNTRQRYASVGDYYYGNHGYDFKGRDKLIRAIDYPMETAVLFYDGEGKLLSSSEDEILFFHYYTEEEWREGMDTTSGLYYGWIDMSQGKETQRGEGDPYLPIRTMLADVPDPWGLPAMRIVGSFAGNQLKPVTVHYITDRQVRQVLESTDQFSTGGGYSYTISQLDQTGLLDWQLLFDYSTDCGREQLVTVYIDRPEMWEYPKSELHYQGTEYQSLAALTEQLDFPSWTEIQRYSKGMRDQGIFQLNELLVFAGKSYADYTGVELGTDREPETDFMLVTAIRSHPLSCAVSALRNLYLATGLLALILVWIVRGQIKKRLVQPVAEIVQAMGDHWKRVYHPDHAPALWGEAEGLAKAFDAEQDWRHIRTNEINRLTTALEYAKAAEQNRRQMTSNIAHELKTPLAVIHSYAEGLKEHIAEEKREKYIDVILAEAERTDALVLEMLDLSRLEAGKVKLSRDEFSLIDLTKAVFEKLERTAQARNLQVEYQFPPPFTITADEGRIAQVIENFASNAVKYTPEGGRIMVCIQNGRDTVSFSIANESAPLPEEALERIWDTFYRVDEARSGGGTGLGLAIAKSIVELHGGSCSVRNTDWGVEFRFTL